MAAQPRAAEEFLLSLQQEEQQADEHLQREVPYDETLQRAGGGERG